MIKILTILGNNYGGCLQAFALQKKIKDMGYDVETINYSEYLNKKVTIKKVLRNIIYFNRNIKYSKFRKNNIKIGKKVTNPIDDGSVYIVGSDQVWNQRIPMEYRKNFYLSFVEDKIRKNTYAASIGDIELDSSEDNLKKIINYISDFNYISVREESAIELIKKVCDKDVINVLDPTLLLTGDEWSNLIKYNKEKEYILVYTLGLNPKNVSIINDISVKKGLKIRDIFYKKRFKNLDKNLNSLGPIEFISSIANSNFVITNSFHGTVFSIIYHKEFLVITRGNMNSRVYDLLKKLGIENRIVKEDELSNVKNLNDFEKINYEQVEKKLDILRRESLDFLSKILSIDNGKVKKYSNE